MRERDRKRFVADRFRRIWAVVQSIADEPGQSRVGLAERFYLSERQIQSDLNIIRQEMGLPLVRRQGYRFEALDPDGAALTAQDIQLLVLLLGRAVRDRSVSPEGIGGLLERLATVFPPHLRPLASDMLAASAGGSRKLQTLGEAALAGTWVKLAYHNPLAQPHGVPEQAVRPLLLLPYLRSWYLIAECETGRQRMVAVDEIAAVSPAALRAAS